MCLVAPPGVFSWSFVTHQPGSMLQSPKNSPFALALGACKFVLVVPNRHMSVYTRLWCGHREALDMKDFWMTLFGAKSVIVLRSLKGEFEV